MKGFGGKLQATILNVEIPECLQYGVLGYEHGDVPLSTGRCTCRAVPSQRGVRTLPAAEFLYQLCTCWY